jgi:hypothetical protein
MLNVFMLSVIMLNVIILNIIMLNVITLSVVAPLLYLFVKIRTECVPLDSSPVGVRLFVARMKNTEKNVATMEQRKDG